VICVFASVYMLCYIYIFVYADTSLHPWNETDLIMVYGFFDVLFNSVSQYFAENSCLCS
jgi:hypothetical protein